MDKMVVPLNGGRNITSSKYIFELYSLSRSLCDLYAVIGEVCQYLCVCV